MNGNEYYKLILLYMEILIDSWRCLTSMAALMTTVSKNSCDLDHFFGILWMIWSSTTHVLILTCSGFLEGLTVNNQAKKQQGRSLRMLLGTLGGSSFDNILTFTGTIRASEATATACQKKNLTNPQLLTNFEIQKYYQNEANFMGFIQEITYLK